MSLAITGRRPALLALYAALALTGCGAHKGNVKTARDYHPPSTPPVTQPYYDSFAPYGSADAVWTPRVSDKNGTLVNTAPRGGAPAGYKSSLRPPGTF